MTQKMIRVVIQRNGEKHEALIPDDGNGADAFTRFMLQHLSYKFELGMRIEIECVNASDSVCPVCQK